MDKPRLFIGSSVEGLPSADALAENLEFDAEVTIWRSGTFKLASNTLDDLVEKTRSVDFAAFIFSPDDITEMRSKTHTNVRDNVVFELGLFIGAIGKERCFIVKPRGVELHIPSDLIGLSSTDFEASRSDENITSALTYAATQIKREMGMKGLYQPISTAKVQKLDVNNVLSDIKDVDMLVLSKLLDGYNSDAEGVTSSYLTSHIPPSASTAELNLSIVKLQRVGLIGKQNTSDMNGNEYFTFSLTDHGVEVCLKNEDRIKDLHLNTKGSNSFGFPPAF